MLHESRSSLKRRLLKSTGVGCGGEDFPKFITAIKTSRRIDANHFAIVEGLGGEQRESVLEFVLRVPERRLVLRSMSDQLAAGVVTFAPRANGTTTVVLTMMSTYGGAVSHRVGAYLQNFKALIEVAHCRTQMRPGLAGPCTRIVLE